MIRFATQDGVGAIDLLQNDDECEFMLEGHGRECPVIFYEFAQFGGVSIGSTDEEADVFAALHFSGFDPLCEIQATSLFTTLIKEDTQASSTGVEHSLSHLLGAAVT